MRKRDGFTVVELVIVIVVIGILLTVAFLGFRSTQLDARDRERVSDVTTIAAYLESIYPQQMMSGSTVVKRAGSYPYTYTLTNAYKDTVFSNLDRSAWYAPGSSSESFMGSSSLSPSPSIDQYYYVPVRLSGSSSYICSGVSYECRSFRIYYRLENGGVQYIEGKHQ